MIKDIDMIATLKSVIELTQKKLLRWKREEGLTSIFVAETGDGCLYTLSEKSEGIRLFEYTDFEGKKKASSTTDMPVDNELQTCEVSEKVKVFLKDI